MKAYPTVFLLSQLTQIFTTRDVNLEYITAEKKNVYLKKYIGNLNISELMQFKELQLATEK